MKDEIRLTPPLLANLRIADFETREGKPIPIELEILERRKQWPLPLRAVRVVVEAVTGKKICSYSSGKLQLNMNLPHQHEK